jgi:hypothetical protein
MQSVKGRVCGARIYTIHVRCAGSAGNATNEYDYGDGALTKCQVRGVRYQERGPALRACRVRSRSGEVLRSSEFQ